VTLDVSADVLGYSERRSPHDRLRSDMRNDSFTVAPIMATGGWQSHRIVSTYTDEDGGDDDAALAYHRKHAAARHK
jgi:hypothetical protein